MWVLETIAVAFSMYSALPMPQFAWSAKNMRYALVAFPLVGVVIGLGWWGVCTISTALALPYLLRGALLCVLPVLVTGGIHLDGYADTHDALASHAPPEKMQEILRDPRCGAFAVIRLCVYFIADFALCCVVEPTKPALWCMGFGFVLSRTLSGNLLTVLPLAKDTGLAHAFATAADKRQVRAILSAETGLCLAGLYLHGGWYVFLAAVCASLAVSLHYAHMSRRFFGGISGDLAGWFLVKTEFWLLAALVAAQALEERI